jgi:UDP-2-acetamido-2-deoxy-ribo-hexuluronate aminotransferase
MEFIDLKAQYKHIEEGIKTRINTVLKHGHYIMGPEVFELEEKLADFVGVKHCITCGNGTDALLMSLMSLGIGQGDEVITTAFSFFATAEVICLLGATPVFVDIDPKTFNIDPTLIESKITEKTKAIIPVSLFGQCADMDIINNTANQHKLPVIEDAAQSFGATYKGKRSCNLSTIACTSFFPAKPLGCYGDGGACFTNDDELAEKLRSIRVHGKGIDKYDNVRIGINSRLDTIQAAILLEKLKIYPKEIEARQTIASEYTRMLGNDIKTPHIPEQNQSVWAQYSIMSDQRDLYILALKKLEIPTAIYYSKPMHHQGALSHLSLGIEQSHPNAEKVAEEIFSIPMHPYLPEKEQFHIISAFLKH